MLKNETNGKFGRVKFCQGELILDLLAQIGEWDQIFENALDQSGRTNGSGELTPKIQSQGFLTTLHILRSVTFKTLSVKIRWKKYVGKSDCT